MRSGLRDLVEEVRRIAFQHEIDYFVFEQSTFSKWFFEDPLFLEFKDRFRTIKHKTNVNKNDSLYGIQSLAWDFEDKHISLPYGDPDGKRMTDEFGKEALNYPEYTTDDMLLALWFVKYNWRRLKPTPPDQPLRTYKLPKGAWSWYADQKKQEPVRREFDQRRVAV
jgi:hypothetical protein